MFGTELGRVGVALALVDGVLVVDVGQTADAAGQDLHDRDRAILGVDEQVALSRHRQGLILDLEVDEQAGRRRLGAGKGERRQFLPERPRVREARAAHLARHGSRIRR